MANSFLDKTGLTYLWGKIVALVNRKQDALTFDSTPTDNSTNPVTSGGVKAYVDANAGGGDSPVESGSGVGSVQTAGNLTYASGDYSNAEGQNAAAIGTGAHAEGDRTLAAGDFSHAEGAVNVQSMYTIYLTGNDGDTVYSFTGVCHVNNAHLWCPGLGKHALAISIDNGTKKATLDKTIGALTNEKCEIYVGTACGTGSHVEGRACVASSAYSHAEGDGCSATALCAHAEGDHCIASGKASHAEGYYTTAKGTYQHVEGKFNVIDTSNKYAHITGIGTSTSTSNRKNGFTVDWSGNGFFAGGVRVGASPSYDNDLTTKQYVDSKVYMAIDERNAPVTLRTRYDEDYGANVLYGYLPSIYEETNIVANAIYLTDAYRYIYEYTDASDNTIAIPLTKAISYNGGNYMQKLIFGNDEAVFVDLPSGVMVPEAEWHGDGE